MTLYVMGNIIKYILRQGDFKKNGFFWHQNEKRQRT